MPAVQSLFSRVTAFLPLELLLIALIAVLVVIDALRNGSRHATIFVVASSLALLLYNAMFQVVFIADKLTPLSNAMKAGVFLALLVVLCVLVYRFIPAFFGSGPSLIQALASGIAVAILLLVLWLQIPALVALRQPIPFIQHLFGNAYYFFWLIGAYGILALVRR